MDCIYQKQAWWWYNETWSEEDGPNKSRKEEEEAEKDLKTIRKTLKPRQEHIKKVIENE